ncbi:MAG: hypothetical protein LC785_17555 [Acidobacteria bacterium]|nr:hypothetical protein [Acidobacteriota bacterium]
MSMLCWRAMLRTSGLDFVRRNSSTVCSRPFFPPPDGCAPPSPDAASPCCPAPGLCSS